MESPDPHSPTSAADQPQTSSSTRKNEKALLARIWGNFDSK